MSADDTEPDPLPGAPPMGRARFLLFQGIIWALLSVIVVLPAIRFPFFDLAASVRWVAGWATLGLLCPASAASRGRRRTCRWRCT